MRSTFALLAAVLAGCVSVQPALSEKDAPAAATGYVAGVFDRNEGANFGFELSNVETGKEVLLSFGSQGVTGRSSEADVTLVAVPPGRYRVSSWHTFGNVGPDGRAVSQNEKAVPYTSRLSRLFTVKAGEVVHLGRFSAYTAETKVGNGTRTSWTITPRAIPYPEAAAWLAKRYPSFAAAPMECLFCDPGTGPRQPGLGTYDVSRVARATAEGMAALAPLAEFTAVRQRRLDEARGRYEKASRLHGAETDPGRKALLAWMVQSHARELRQVRETALDEIAAEEERLTKPLVERLKPLADALRVEKGLAKVAPKDTLVATGEDLTDELARRYDARYPPAPELTPAAAPAAP